jgi:bifunctional DNase/RNase
MVKRKEKIIYLIAFLSFVFVAIIIFYYIKVQMLLKEEGFIPMQIDKIELLENNARISLKGHCSNIFIYTTPEQAQAINEGLQERILQRPLTHDIIVDILNNFNIKPLIVKITDLKDNTYYSELILQKWNSALILDIRPSDAIAISARTDTPIIVNKTLVTWIC